MTLSSGNTLYEVSSKSAVCPRVGGCSNLPARVEPP
jgi:hypothetical protein